MAPQSTDPVHDVAWQGGREYMEDRMAFAGRLQGACTCDGMPLHMIIMTSPHTVLLPLNQQGGRAPATTRSLTGTVAPLRLSESTTSVAVCAAYTPHTQNPPTLTQLPPHFMAGHQLLPGSHAPPHDGPAGAARRPRGRAQGGLPRHGPGGGEGRGAYMLDRVGSGEGIFFVSSH